MSQASPSIKGSALTAVVEDVNHLRAAGRVDDTMLKTRLEPGDRALLGETIQAARWYPIAAYGRLTDLLLEVAGGGRAAYLNERGAKTARRLIESGIYHQLERASGSDAIDPRTLSREERAREFTRTVRLTVSLSGSIFNFGRWSVGTDPTHAERLRIVIEDAAAMPDAAIRTIEGFINEIGEASPHIAHLRWTGERTATDTIVYTMDDDIDEVYVRA